MPLVARIDSEQATQTVKVFAESSSEAAALPNGQKALTPIIAGTISGTCIGVAWLIALVAALVKRHKRKKKYKKVGRPDLVNEHPKPEAFIVPPDPAVVEGQYKPGDRIIVGKDKKHKHKSSIAKGKEKADGVIEENETFSGVAHMEGPGQMAANGERKDRSPRRPGAFARMSTIWSTSGSRQASAENINRVDPRSRAQSPQTGSTTENTGKAPDRAERYPVRGPTQAPKANGYAYEQEPQGERPVELSDLGAHVHLYPPSRQR